MRAAALAVGLVFAAPAAAGLGVLPPEAPDDEVPALEPVTVRIPVRSEAGTLGFIGPGDPVGQVGLASPDGEPATTEPLGSDPIFDLPPPGEACWRGYCGVHHVVATFLAPPADGPVTVDLALEADGVRVVTPVHLNVAPQGPQAVVGDEAVRVEVPHARGLDGVHLRTDGEAWAAAPTGGAFTLPRERLPAGTPLTPTLTLRNGTVVTGPPVELPWEDPQKGRGPAPELGDEAEGNASHDPTAPAPGPSPSPDPPKPPVRAADEGGHPLPGPGLAAGLALAGAAGARRYFKCVQGG